MDLENAKIEQLHVQDQPQHFLGQGVPPQNEFNQQIPQALRYDENQNLLKQIQNPVLQHLLKFERYRNSFMEKYYLTIIWVFVIFLFGIGILGSGLLEYMAVPVFIFIIEYIYMIIVYKKAYKEVIGKFDFSQIQTILDCIRKSNIAQVVSQIITFIFLVLAIGILSSGKLDKRIAKFVRHDYSDDESDDDEDDGEYKDSEDKEDEIEEYRINLQEVLGAFIFITIIYNVIHYIYKRRLITKLNKMNQVYNSNSSSNQQTDNRNDNNRQMQVRNSNY